MYSYVRAICLSRSAGSQLEEIDLTGYTIGSIFSNYSEIFLELSNPYITGNVFIDLNQLRDEYSISNLNLANVFIDIGSRTLDTVPSLPSTDIKYVKYSDAFRAEYKVDLCRIGFVAPSGYVSNSFQDLKLSRPKYITDVTKIHTYCLVSVNGYFHWTEKDTSYTYIKDGASTMRKSRHNQIGIMSFLDVASLKKIAIKDSDITTYGTSTLKDRVYLSLDEDLTNKSVILVLGGYLVFPQKDIFWQSGDKVFNLDINRIPYIERIYESSLYLNLDSLELPSDAINPDMLNTDNLKTDAVIRKYLTLSQSYFVVV